MILEGIIICVGYSDFIAHTLPLNKSHFDKLVVVTSTTDKETQRLCEYHHVECIQTDIFYENGDVFNKAKGINIGLKALTQEGWVLHLDGDIVLPPLFRETIEPIMLDEKCVYGVDRLMCTNYDDWVEHVATPHLMQEAYIFIHPYYKSMPIGTRIAKYGTVEGYIPIGFFQLWNPICSGINHYPQEHGDAGRSDMLFAMQWPRNKRGFIPEIITIHLESEKLVSMGKNWKGRQTRPFGPVIQSNIIKKDTIEEPKPIKDIVCYGNIETEPIQNAPIEAISPNSTKSSFFSSLIHKDMLTIFLPISVVILGLEFFSILSGIK